jgi:hypothetical protein
MLPIQSAVLLPSEARVDGMTTSKPSAKGTRKPYANSPAQQAALQKGRDLQKARGLVAAEMRAAGIRTRWEMYIAGDLRIADADNEEVKRGRFKDNGGGFVGRAPNMTARQYNEWHQELLKRGRSKLNGMYMTALDAVDEIVRSGISEDRDRLKAATIIMERVSGKVPDRIEVGPVDAFADALEGLIGEAVKNAPEIGER